MSFVPLNCKGGGGGPGFTALSVGIIASNSLSVKPAKDQWAGKAKVETMEIARTTKEAKRAIAGGCWFYHQFLGGVLYDLQLNSHVKSKIKKLISNAECCPSLPAKDRDQDRERIRLTHYGLDLGPREEHETSLKLSVRERLGFNVYR